LGLSEREVWEVGAAVARVFRRRRRKRKRKRKRRRRRRRRRRMAAVTQIREMNHHQLLR